ncbi:multifunctional oxoglutarate decarboxylase/oxoglutarate dehydrogenase thiamine pyrophosphate-binding subunit/dihydrolipoyllysine-residue succinyltransferase subunit [Streptomyces sp. NBC_01341]|uniref:multifunctional oxoglutarate decarboxylase/oxoglutarate dehydrogenase thiamine pyrophosphate-binding subunit/dihydrolipoyllysine-residue succinyltransferase subunit n=1 Tax=Streptomyces sp. NBC_01341 TaxID=2903831 RepID=UPI002E1529B9|nr:multifunctional oxoglutarate decarboxylase/oxoglutarate dehydrogenase thiamine pyrophosphate-binding subunit/dihydrolipoyllysine-residue succinyltransferase subunit [Streptomyces sp. NBC_01341]
MPHAQSTTSEVPQDKSGADRAVAQDSAGARTDYTPLKGPAKSLASHMDASLSVPTATSVRDVPAKLMIDNRLAVNDHLARNRGGRVSFTHLIAWALVRAAKDFPAQNVAYGERDGKPVLIRHPHVNFGIAVDLTRADGTRMLVVPNIKQADRMGFSEFFQACEELVARARTNRLTADDFAGTTLSLTNPGSIGTTSSVPRLMTGQGSVIGAGALEYPAAYRGAAAQTLNDLAIGKVITLTSTYDHRVIQGAGSGEFLRRVQQLLQGADDFYGDIFAELRIPYEPINWAQDIHVGRQNMMDRTARVQQLINAFRVRGHLMADIDPLIYRQRSHPDLDPASHGLSFWDLDREFATEDLAGNGSPMTLRDILRVMRDAYCRTVGVEYMHIQEPEQRRWFQERLEAPYVKPTHDEQLRILGKLNEAEAFETFLQTKYVGQTRFSLEGAEAAIALLDAVLGCAVEHGMDGAAIAMAHRGRLNVLTNLAGKTYSQVFREFDGTADGQLSGDVKYHLGTEGRYRSGDGRELPVHLAANPSHLDAVDAVLLGVVRAKQDRSTGRRFATLPIVIHGDAAMAGQGVVSETVQMSQLPGYGVGGVIRVNINNQVGFTTLPVDGRSSVYATDVVKATQTPVFHVNGDDPEAVVRVATLAFAYRERFHRDVVIDLVSYRRRGHNEADDPSMTQPGMYRRIADKGSVRTLYLEALTGRGDITHAEYEQAHQDFQARLERAFAETRDSGPDASDTADSGEAALVAGLERGTLPSVGRPRPVTAAALAAVGEAFTDLPDGFAVHPKLGQLLDRRQRMARGDAPVDWAFAELLAFGSLLDEGLPVRLAGQDSRRGTFTQRQAVLHDRESGAQWQPLARFRGQDTDFHLYDSWLSEYAAMGFEYGYSVERPEALVIWEAQFGDFVNGAQIVVDEFVSSAEQKWGQASSVTLLLPHGYEGSGPDHSSARIERFLQLCAEENMTVAQPSTAASYFHLLRRQAYARPRKPLVVFTPKSMLRTKSSFSSLDGLTGGTFEPVLDEPVPLDRDAVRRVVLVTGKLYHELAAHLGKFPDPGIALVRVEQLYPLPLEELRRVTDSYSRAELVWAQEEPRNQGAWTFLLSEAAPSLSRPLRLVSRPAAAAPATGSHKRHTKEQQELIRRILD